MNKEEDISKEVLGIMEAVDVYRKKHNGNVGIIIDVCAFDENNEVIDDRILLDGKPEVIKTMIEELPEDLKE